MGQINDLRSALRENLKQIAGIQVSRYALYNPTPPGIHLWPSEIPAYHKVFGRPPQLSEIHFTVEAFVAFGTDIGSQEYMDQMLEPNGDKSVVAAIESDVTLAGACQDLIVVSSTSYQPIMTPDSRQLLTSEWLVTIIL